MGFAAAVRTLSDGKKFEAAADAGGDVPDLSAIAVRSRVSTELCMPNVGRQ